MQQRLKFKFNKIKSKDKHKTDEMDINQFNNVMENTQNNLNKSQMLSSYSKSPKKQQTKKNKKALKNRSISIEGFFKGSSRADKLQGKMFQQMDS